MSNVVLTKREALLLSKTMFHFLQNENNALSFSEDQEKLEEVIEQIDTQLCGDSQEEEDDRPEYDETDYDGDCDCDYGNTCSRHRDEEE